MNWFNLDHSVEAIALSKSQTGPSGVSASRYAHRAERLALPRRHPCRRGQPVPQFIDYHPRNSVQ